VDPPAATRNNARLLLPAVVGAFVLTLIVHGLRVALAPDIFGDEGLYYLVARNAATGAGLLDDTGHVFFWHPPLYPLLASMYTGLTGGTQLDFVAGLLASRQLNVILSAVTAAVLVVFGWRLAGLRAGLLMALVFLLDPFVERVNRRAMLETLSMLLVLVGVVAFDPRGRVPTRSRVLLAGLAFGLALLTKEVAVIGLLGIGLAVLAFERQARRAAAAVWGIALAVYALFPLWALATGELDRFLLFRLGAVLRVLRISTVVLPPEARVTTPPAADPVSRAAAALLDYGPSYLLLAGGALATAWLLLRQRDDSASRYVATWSAVSYVCVAGGVLGGFGDQFYYYVLVPAIVAIGLAAARWWARPVTSTMQRTLRGSAVVGLCAVLTLNAALWTGRYALGRDDAYARLVPEVLQAVPPGSTILVSSDVPNFLLRPRYDTSFLRDQGSIERAGIRWFLLSSKDASFGYNNMSPDLYDWVMSHTVRVAEEDGSTFRTLGLYRWTGPAAATP
jgi:4-amino-4-deoxy-L-arabinose transferase-like glycosyltransferase